MLFDNSDYDVEGSVDKVIDIINANTDLGVHVDGARLGPDKLTEDLIIKNNKSIFVKEIIKDYSKYIEFI